MLPTSSMPNSISFIQNNYYDSLPDSLLTALLHEKNPDLAKKKFKEISQDWHVWYDAAKELNADVKKIQQDDPNPRTTLVKCQEAINAHYKKINDSFEYLYLLAQDEVGTDPSNSGFPENEKQGILAEAKYHKILLDYIKLHNNEVLFDTILFKSVKNYDVLKMLLEDGVEPIAPNDLEGGEQDGWDVKSLVWALLVSANEDFPVDLKYCKLILDSHTLDTQAMTFLLWCACQYNDDGSEGKQIEVLDYLVSKGAVWDLAILKHYSPITSLGYHLPESFAHHNITASRPSVAEYIKSHASCM